jgi:hypothetical protein
MTGLDTSGWPVLPGNTRADRPATARIAWTLARPPHVLGALMNTGVAVLGGDFWVKADSGTYRPTYENWYVAETPGEPGGDFAARSIGRARDEVGRRRHTAYLVTFTCEFPE